MLNSLMKFDFPLLITCIGLVAIVISFILYMSSTSSRKINQSKKVISSCLERSIKGKHYVITDVPLVTKDGKEYNIDNVLICQNGIFLFESKIYSSGTTLMGREDEETWVEVVSNNPNKAKDIANPTLEVNDYKDVIFEIVDKDIPVHAHIVFLINKINVKNHKIAINPYEIEKIANEEKEEIISEEQIEIAYKQILEYKTAHSGENK